MTFSAFAELTNFAAGYLDPVSCTIITCLDDDIGPKRSTATTSQFFVGTLCWANGSTDFFFICNYFTINGCIDIANNF